MEMWDIDQDEAKQILIDIIIKLVEFSMVAVLVGIAVLMFIGILKII